jgi:type II secretory pathway pseudopilin PulG
MIERQRGALSLVRVAIFSALLAAAAMAALWSMRYERNQFAEGAAALTGTAPARQAIDAARGAVAAAAGDKGANGALRKCVIDAKTVISNTECLDSNKTSKTIKIHDTRGFEAPKVPVAPAAARTSDPALDKIIEKQLQ